MADMSDSISPEDRNDDQYEISQTKHKSIFRNVSTDLELEDLDSPGAKRLLISNYEQLQLEKETLIGFQGKYHQAELELANVKARLHKRKVHEIMYGSMLIIGSALVVVGISPLQNLAGTGLQLVFSSLGLLLVGGAIWSRVYDK